MIGVPEGNVEAANVGVGQFATQFILEGLTQLGIEGRPLPWLAASWDWEHDERRLRVRLREDVILHDGRPFDSQVAAQALALAIARPVNRATYLALGDITAAIPDGPFELVLHLSRRSALLPEDLTIPLDVATGPYRETGRDETTITLERFGDYYLGTPSISRVELRGFDTLRTTWARLLRGDVAVVSDVPADAVEFIQSDAVQVLPMKRWYQFLIAFNSERGALRSPTVRRALNMAIDRDALIRDVLRGSGSPSYGPLWPEFWAYDASITPPSFNPELAVSLLDGAGFEMQGESNRGDLPPARLRFTCLIPENYTVWQRIALKVQKDLFNIGVDMQFRVVPVEEFTNLLGTGQFDAAFIDMISGPTPGRAYIFWASSRRFPGAYNVFGYENAEVERQFETLRTTRNEAAVRSATARLQRVFINDPPALFLAWNERARAVHRDFVVPDEAGRDPLLSLWRWTRRSDTLIASNP